MNTRLIEVGDEVMVSKNGCREFPALIVEKEPWSLLIEPLIPNVSWRRVKSREITRKIRSGSTLNDATIRSNIGKREREE